MKFINYLSPRFVLRTISYWPPYFFSGISVSYISQDLTEIVVKKKNHFWNRNYFGTHFGGALYAMCDPFYAFILLEKLRKDHIVWDKSAEIEFLRAVPEPVTVRFSINEETIEEIRKLCLENYKQEPVFHAKIVDPQGEIVAKVRKTLYVRRKDAKSRFSGEKTP